jgi:flagellar biosynthesis protein FlhG
MTDQAKALRGLMETRHNAPAAVHPADEPSTARIISLTSGKGGVGKSNVALNLAVSLARSGAAVCLVDANLGLGNIDLLCGLNGYWNLSHVITGARTLSDVMLEGPAGVHVIPGASGIADVADCDEAARNDVLRQLEKIEREHDYIVVDTGTGIHKSVRQFVTAADIILILTTAEATSIADAYATIKSLSTDNLGELDLLVTQVDSPQHARTVFSRLEQTARLFLRTGLEYAGWIPRDAAVVQAVARQTPFVVESPYCPASRSVVQLAQHIAKLAAARSPRGRFFERLSLSRQRAA